MTKYDYDEKTKITTTVYSGYLLFDEFVETANKSNELRHSKKSVKLVVNIQKMSVLSLEIQQWIKDVWFPKAVETGLKYIAFIVPKSALGAMSMKNANKEAEEKSTIETRYFDNEQDGKNWLISKY